MKEETKEKIRIALRGNKNGEGKRSREFCENMSTKLKGRKVSWGHKTSKGLRGKLTGSKSPSWRGGKPKCLDCGAQLKDYHSKRCFPCVNKFKIGPNNPKWKGGYENKLMLNRKRRIIKLGCGGSHILGEWEILKAQYNWTCPCCGNIEPNIVLTEDHIIPVSKGGSDNIENIQPLCRACNSKKHDKIIKY